MYDVYGEERTTGLYHLNLKPTSRMEYIYRAALFTSNIEDRSDILNIPFFQHLLHERVGKLLSLKHLIYEYDIKHKWGLNTLVEYHKKYIKNKNTPTDYRVLVAAKAMYILMAYKHKTPNPYKWLENKVRSEINRMVKERTLDENVILFESSKYTISLIFGELKLTEYKNIKEKMVEVGVYSIPVNVEVNI
jgi:hypothetical protein